MALLLPVCFAVACFGLLVFMRQWLRKMRATPRAHGAFSLTILGGALLGVALSLKCSYALGEGKRVTGVPLPVLLQKLEEGQWRDFSPARHVVGALVVANSAIVSAALGGPVFLFLMLRTSPSPKSA